MEPITGTVFDIRRFTMNDGPGVRVTVFLKGCPLRCAWCHNPEGRDPSPVTVNYEVKDCDGNVSSVSDTIGTTFTPEELLETILSEKAVMQGSGGGITFSGGEPLMQYRFLLPVLKACHEQGIHTAIDTNGYSPSEVFEEVIPYTDLFLFDLKHANRQKHLEYTSVSTVKILENLELILSKGAQVWIRVPVIPGFNHSRQDIAEIIRVLKAMPKGISQVELIPYRKTAADKYRRLGYHNSMGDTPSLSPARLRPYRRMFRRAGFDTIIGS
ncbi:MAG: glycyl-radical enzyme activating protein [Bacteroidales bacterium]